jgi:hypothetical protein
MLQNANHYIFVDVCPAVLLRLDSFGACSDHVWDLSRAHDLTNHLVTAFLLAELHNNTAAAEALHPENIDFVGITYETTR